MRHARSAFRRSHCFGVLDPPVVREHAVAAATDLEVGLADPPDVDLGEHRLHHVGIGDRDEAPGEPGAVQLCEQLAATSVSTWVTPGSARDASRTGRTGCVRPARRRVPFGIGDGPRDGRIGGEVLGA